MRYLYLTLPLLFSGCGVVVSEEKNHEPPKHVSYAVYQIDHDYNVTTQLYSNCISLEKRYDSATVIVGEYHGDEIEFHYDLDPFDLEIQVYINGRLVEFDTYDRDSFVRGYDVSMEFTSYDHIDHRIDLTGPGCMRY